MFEHFLEICLVFWSANIKMLIECGGRSVTVSGRGRETNTHIHRLKDRQIDRRNDKLRYRQICGLTIVIKTR